MSEDGASPAADVMHESEPSDGARSPSLRTCLFAIAVFAFIAYGNALSASWVFWDDGASIFETHSLERIDGAALIRLFDPRASRAEFEWEYTPLSDLSYAFDRRVLGTSNPGLEHLENVLWHVLTACLFCALVDRQTRSRGLALVAALVFSLHPVGTDAVTWISGRRTLLVAVFTLMSALAWQRWISKPGVGALGASIGCALLANLSKQSAVALPLLLLALEATSPTSAGRARRARALAYVPHVALALVFTAIGLLVGAREGTVGTHAIAPVERLEVSCVGLARYWEIFFWPHDLRPHYTLIFSSAELALRVAIGGLIALLLLAAAALYRRSPALSLGASGVLATLAPALGGVGIHAVAERYCYLTLGFMAVTVASLLGPLLRAWSRPAADRTPGLRNPLAAAGLSAMLCSLALATHIRNRAWQDDLSLWTAAVEADPNDPLPHEYRGRALGRAGRFTEAEPELLRAAWLVDHLGGPGDEKLAVILDEVATVREAAHDTAGAEAWYRAALDRRPGSTAAAIALGDFYRRCGAKEKAEAAYRAAAGRDPKARARLREIGEGDK